MNIIGVMSPSLNFSSKFQGNFRAEKLWVRGKETAVSKAFLALKLFVLPSINMPKIEHNNVKSRGVYLPASERSER